MNKSIIVAILSMVAIVSNAQKGLDTQRLKTIERLIELEIPAEEPHWFTDRARVDDYEIPAGTKSSKKRVRSWHRS